MGSLIEVLPQEAQEFVAECRKMSYTTDATPERAPDSNRYGFVYRKGGFVLTDSSVELNGRFSGEETLKTVGGREIYVCQYAGTNTPLARTFPEGLVDRVQHGLVIANRDVRAGAYSVDKKVTKDGIDFSYLEILLDHDEGRRTNSERLMTLVGDRFLPVYKGVTTLTLFDIR